MKPLIERRSVALELKAAKEAGSFEGYGSVFDVVDSYGDAIEKGAFKDTLRSWRLKSKTPPMLLQHGGWGMGATDMVPIGKWDAMEEDDHGLYVKGHLLAMDTERSKQVYAAMKEGALDGLSIGFVTKEVRMGEKPSEPARTLTAVDLWEVSIVTFPANGEARVGAMKADADMTEREFESFLRDAGFTRRDAQCIISRGFAALRDSALEPAPPALRDSAPSPAGLFSSDELKAIIADPYRTLKSA
jgi:HK97 family phage prohead protease